jgi:hypothetical protein
MKKTYLRGIAAAVFLTACMALFFSCGGGGGSSPAPGPSGSGDQYEITVAAVTPANSGTVTTNPPGKSEANKTVTITAVPTGSYAVAQGFPRVTKETGGGSVGVTLGGSANTWTFIMPADDVIVTVQFRVPGTNPFSSPPVVNLTALPTAFSYTITPSNPAADSYVLYYTAGSGKTAAEVKAGTMVDVTGITGTVRDLQAGAVYSVLVTAVKDTYIDSESTIKTVTTLAEVAAGQRNIYLPSGVTASKTEDLDNGEFVALSVTPPSGRAVAFVTVTGMSTGRQVRVDGCSTFTMPDESVSVSVQYGPEQVVPIFTEGALGMDRQIWNPAHDENPGYYTWEIDEDTGEFLGGINGNPALKIELDEAWSQLLFCAAPEQPPFNINSFKALSFWVRADSAGKFANVQFGGGDDGYAVVYRGENNDGIPFTTEWSRVIVPVPRSGISAAINRAMLFTAGDGLLYGKTLYIDRAELVDCDVVLDSIEIVPDTALQINSGDFETPVSEVLFGSMKVKYIVDGQTVTLVNGGNVDFFEWFGNSINITVSGGGVTLNNGKLSGGTSGASYTMTAAFGGKTSNAASLKVSTLKYIIIDSFDPKTVSPAIPDAPAINGDTGGGAWWIGPTDEFGPNSVAVMVSSAGDANYTRIYGGPWDLSAYDLITVNYLVKSTDGAQGTGAIPATCRAFIDVREGAATWRNCTVQLTRTNYQTWYSQTLRKSNYPAATNWKNITAWRIRIAGSPAAGTVHYISDIRATTE